MMMDDILPRRCHKCGCTDLAACVDEDGPCCWVDDNLCSACQTKAEKATAAAHQAVEAAGELLRYAREGRALEGTFADDVVGKLADALKLAFEIDPPGVDVLATAASTFLEGYVP
jgi:hypothetical protein